MTEPADYTCAAEGRQARHPWRLWLWIIAASALAHLWCLASQFYMDDTMAILDNRLVLTGKFWLNPTGAWTTLGYIVQARMFGLSPMAVHAVNWLLHTAVACVVLGFGRDFLRGRAPAGVAWFAALCFAVHPLASEIPNYARTQDIAWVTLFSLLASWALLRFLRDGGWTKLLWMVLAILGASVSKGPGLFHALMMTGVIGLAFISPDQARALRRHGLWLGAAILLAGATLWSAGILAIPLAATRLWGEPRFIGHAYTLARVFWEFAWRSVLPLAQSSDHHIAETLVPPGAHFWNIPDTGAMWAATAMLALTVFSLWLAWRPATRPFGVCLLLFVSTILFRMAYLIPEFMPEYRVYPGLPWFCLGAAITLAAAWRRLLGKAPPQFAAALLLVLFAGLSARRSFLWHDLDRLTADILRQYPAQARAVWELHDRDASAGDWQKIIARQRTAWPKVVQHFEAENRRLAPQRELPTGHFVLAIVACIGRHAQALAHVTNPAAGMAELKGLENYMHRSHLDPVEHQQYWNYFFNAKVLVLEQAGNYQAARNLIHQQGAERFPPTVIERIERKITPSS